MLDLSGCVYTLHIVLQIVIALKIFIVLTTGKCRSQKCLVGKTAVVTGGNSGIGYNVALNLASRGCKVIIGDVVDATTTVNKIIKSTNNENVFYKYVDFASLDSVRKFAGDILKTENQLDILFNNAGVGGFEGDYTSDNLPKIMQVNYFAHFLLTHLLVGLLQRTNSSRVVFVSSCMAFTHAISNADDINTLDSVSFKKTVWGHLLAKTTTDYGSSKLCLLIASNYFAQKLKPYGITVAAVHPGYVDTGIINRAQKNTNKIQILYVFHVIISWWATKTASEGAQMVLDVGLSDEIQPGGYYVDNVDFRQPSATRDVSLCEEIWKKSENLVGLRDEEKLDFVLKLKLPSEK